MTGLGIAYMEIPLADWWYAYEDLFFADIEAAPIDSDVGG